MMLTALLSQQSPVYPIFGCILQAIWQNVFHNTSFTCQAMLASLEQMVPRLHHGISYSFD